MNAMNDWLDASHELQDRLLPLTSRLQMSEAEVLRSELDVLLGRQQQLLDAVLAKMASAADVENAAELVERLERRTFVALCALWNHHNQRWHARRASPGATPWMPERQHVWRAVLISMIHDPSLAQRTTRALWPQRDQAAGRSSPLLRLLHREPRALSESA